MNQRAIRFYDDHPAPATMLEEVLQGLASRPRRIAPKFFYDERGSRLFDAICELPEYYPTRTEMGILESCADEVARLSGPDGTLIELGSGASKKIRLLLEAVRPRRYLGIDISREFLRQSVQRLAHDYPWLEVQAACTDFMQDFELPGGAGEGKKLAFFPGSTIGNFEPHDALAFLQRVRRLVQPDGALLIGVDLKKDPQILHAAYNDSAGITAQFNLNLLLRLRDELGAELDPQGFRHRAFYNTARGRIEMHLISRRAQDIRLLGRRFHFEPGESIHTENSYKYTLEEFHVLARGAGLRPRQAWLDSAHLFSVHYLSVVSRSRPRAA
ncbi:MAG: L-histidine N(alpha)-methyltransferase [Sulfuricaulis sp.]|uniref:L-histidine N(alpha)-methyltransferase n=1 Tax=Sulfuricaulis sp. TaxID=2003553 RepID=UPI0025D4148B|nr:L-histidine N(alpha)-methyltransferase [Sulfuricaulis sp.]MCR4347579.1 L-histidine N(alpha)-methyltransferase [Sulfuricaulis sp.]